MPSNGHDAMPIVGYSEPWSGVAGDDIDFMVSTTAHEFTASIVRLRHGDKKMPGPGERFVPIPSAIDGTYAGIVQPIRLGSFAVVDGSSGADFTRGFTLHAWVMPTGAPPSEPRAVVGSWSADEGFELTLDADGVVTVRVGDTHVSTTEGVRRDEWTFVYGTFDPSTGSASVGFRRQRPLSGERAETSSQARLEVSTTVASRRDLLVGGVYRDDVPYGSFEGKIDRPGAHTRPLSEAEISSTASSGSAAPTDSLVGQWEPGREIDAVEFPDVLTGRHPLRCVNTPMHAVTGHNWTGADTDFRRCPEQYGALGLHRDDLEDAAWLPSLTLTIPDDLPSAIYALRLETLGAEPAIDHVPFFVRPHDRADLRDIVFLAPTLSYLAYANEHSAAAVHSETADFDIEAHYQPEDRYAIAVPVSGLYDHHADGSGHNYSSRRRPNVSMRPGYHLPVARSAHQLSADLHLIDWLEEKAMDHDVVTDHDLHELGSSLLVPYAVVVTGSHPEYWTEQMLDALEAYLERGGRLMYMGGNGFYWVTSVSRSRPHLIEVRRGRRGTASWRNEPGEDHHSTTGEPGGLWRDRGRAPQRIGAVGMTAQGFGHAVGYVRTSESRDADVAWIFDGVEADRFGGEGLVLGGAAGFEVDRMDIALGTPSDARRVAVSTGFTDEYQHVVEEVTTSDSKQGGTVSPSVRADVVFSPRPGGGAVFATGSIAWCGALSADGYNTDVSRITENVLRRFADRSATFR